VNATRSGGSVEALSPEPTGGGVNPTGTLSNPIGVAAGTAVGTDVGSVPGAGLLKSRSATAI
jgi:hypothetical protein